MKSGDVIVMNMGRVFNWNTHVNVVLKVEGKALWVLDGNTVRKISVLLEGDCFEVIR